MLHDVTHNDFYMTTVMVEAIANSKACQDTIKADYQLGSMMTGYPGLQPIVENARRLFIALVEGVEEICECLKTYQNANGTGANFNCGTQIREYPDGKGGSHNTSISIGQ